MKIHTTTIQPPTLLAVTVEQVRLDLRLGGDDGSHNELIADAIRAATATFEAETGLTIMPQGKRASLHNFPAGNQPIYLPPPVLSVQAMSWWDWTREFKTMDPADYELVTVGHPARILPTDRWPTTAPRYAAIQIDYTAGHQDANAVPADIRAAIRLLAVHFYENPSATSEKQQHELPLGFSRIVQNHAMPRM